MREKAYTDGPWGVTKDYPPNAYGIASGFSDEQPIVAMTDISGCDNCSSVFYGADTIVEIVANAHLIASAPELLEALESAVKTAEADNSPFRTWHTKARIAITKAYGG